MVLMASDASRGASGPRRVLLIGVALAFLVYATELVLAIVHCAVATSALYNILVMAFFLFLAVGTCLLLLLSVRARSEGLWFMWFWCGIWLINALTALVRLVRG